MMYQDNVKITNGKLIFTDKHGNVLSMRQAKQKIYNRVYNWWLDFRLFLIHGISIHVPFWGIRKLVFELAGVKIGKGSVIHMGCRFFEPKNITIGEDSIVGNNAFLDGRANLSIGSHVDIASEVMIYNSEHNIESPVFEAREEPVIIQDYSFVGPRVIILPGVTIGEGAIIGAGAVVTKNVAKKVMVGGVPAKEIGIRKIRDLNYRLGRSRLFQ